MEQVDEILLPILVQTGCNFGKEVKSFDEFDANMLLQACAKCFAAIDSQYKFATKFPDSKARRFRISQRLSKVFEERGYRHEIGYETFLYPSSTTTRELMIWLVDQLPKAEKKRSGPVTTGGTQNQRILSSLSRWKRSIWMPPRRSRKSGFNSVYVSIPNDFSKKSAYPAELLPLVTLQPPDRHQMAPSLLERNAMDFAAERAREEAMAYSQNAEARKKALQARLGAAVAAAVKAGEASLRTRMLASKQSLADLALDQTAFTRKARFGFREDQTVELVDEEGNVQKVNAETGETVHDGTEEEVEQQREAEQQKLQRKLKKMAVKLEKIQQEIQRQENANKALLEQLKADKEASDEQGKEVDAKKKALSLLPDAENNYRKLQEIIDASKQKVIGLKREWEEKKVRLMGEYENRKGGLDKRKQLAKEKLGEIKKMRVEMKNMARTIREKGEIQTQKIEELNKLPKTVNRNHYVKRIMDIVKTLAQQKSEISKVLKDVNAIQKDTNKITETSQRTYILADEMVFKSAQRAKGEAKAKLGLAYKYVVKMREKFGTLVETIRNTSNTQNDVSDLTTQIETLESANTNLNMARIQEDISQVKEENQQLARKLKKLRGIT